MQHEVARVFGDDKVYLCGGAVRDLLLGNDPKDHDYTTPLSPDDIEAAVRAAGKHPYLIGKKFGTVGMKIDGQLVEVTTFRTETYEKGSRKPQVEFVDDITHDLSRRDFTINAIAKRGDRYIDPFGGRLDLLERVIKAVGRPQDRYKEDPLRMLRAARFASQLGFTVESNTEGQAMRMCHRILMVSRERWMIELNKLLPELALQIGYDQNSPYHALPLWDHTLAVVDATPADLDLRWTALLHDIGKPFVRTEKPDRSNYIKHDLPGADLVTRLALYLKWSNDRRESVTALVLNHMQASSPLRPYDMEAH